MLSGPVVNAYPLSSYTFGTKEPKMEKYTSVAHSHCTEHAGAPCYPFKRSRHVALASWGRNHKTKTRNFRRVRERFFFRQRFFFFHFLQEGSVTISRVVMQLSFTHFSFRRSCQHCFSNVRTSFNNEVQCRCGRGSMSLFFFLNVYDSQRYSEEQAGRFK